MNILVVEDNLDVADALRFGLQRAGYRVEVATDGASGEEIALAGSFDLLVVDWMLPRQDGLQLIAALRNRGLRTPILMLTALTDKQDQIAALDGGADDYLPKPFSFAVLLARIRALARRSNPDPGEGEPRPQVRRGSLVLYPLEHAAFVADAPVPLRAKEFQLLETLAQHEGIVVSRSALAERVWGNLFVSDAVLNTTVTSLRRKLRAATPPGAKTPDVQTVRGVGYRLARL